VRGVSKTLAAVLVLLLLAAGLAACGGGDNSSSTEVGAQVQSEGKSSGGASKQSEADNGGDEGKSGSAGGDGNSESPSSAGSASSFVPKHHKDSGGGSEQFKVKGGDNSVQEFGAEADTSELDAAATALHDFLDARAEGNWAAACNYMSKSVTESFEKLAAQGGAKGDTSCAATLEKLINPNAKALMKAEAAKADVGSLRIEGGQAFVIYTGTEGTVLAMPMANEGGAWKVAGLAGTPLS
jgi:hypothetical protein